MGALIQTKGTQLLATFFSSQFDAGATAPVNLNYLRAAAGLNFQTSPSLYRLSESNLTTGPASMPLFYPFPSVPLSANVASGSSTLTFNAVPQWVTAGIYVVADDSANAIQAGTKVQAVASNTAVTITLPTQNAIPAGKAVTFITFPVVTLATTAASTNQTLTFAAVPSTVTTGMGVVDFTTPGAIPTNTTVTNKSATTVTISNPATAVGNGDVIAFLRGGNHQNLQRRWKYYLKNELRPSSDAEIRAALQEALEDTNITRVQFDVIEGTKQIVHTAVEYNFDANLGVLSTTNKHIRIVLETPPTSASSALPIPLPLDDQFS
jgi:hypothetical protein